MAIPGAGLIPTLGRAALTGASAGGVELAGGGTPKQAAIQAAIQGPGGEAFTAFRLAGPLTRTAGRSLARKLGITEKAFQFGREPAQEVLERGIKGLRLDTLVTNIKQASKEVTSDLNQLLDKAKGVIDGEQLALEISNRFPPGIGARFLASVDDAVLRLKITNVRQMTATQANQLKQEAAKFAKFVEGDIKPAVANAGKEFGGALKDKLLSLAPKAKDLLESSANLTEASKAGERAMRVVKTGRPQTGFGGLDIGRPTTYARTLTDTIAGAKLLFGLAHQLKDAVGHSAALRIAFAAAFPGDEEGE